MSFNNKKHYSLSETYFGIASGITSVFVFIILAFFPLYTHDMYFDILGARYVFFKIWAILLCSLLSALGIIYLIVGFKLGIITQAADLINPNEKSSAYTNFVSFFNFNSIKKNIIPTDIFFFAMFIVCIISTIGSEFKEESFFGNAGRYQGLECWILYFVSYVAITRTYRFKKIHLDFAILAGCFACIWGILDFFWLDPFGFFVNVSDTQKSMFASSIGNLDTFTNYTVMIFAVSASLFMVEKNVFKSIFYGLTSIIGCAGCVYGLADNAVLGLFAFYLFVPFFMFRTRRHVVRYLMSIDFLLITMFFLWISLKAPTYNRWQGSFFIEFVNKGFIHFMFIPYTVLVAIITFVLIKIKPNYGTEVNNNLNSLDSLLPKQVNIIYSVIVFVGFAFVIYILLDVNVFKKHLDIWNQIPSAHQLRFDDNWGTHRGHNWRIAFTNFTQNFNLFQKLFGHGPDTYLVVSERTFYREMVDRYGEVYDSAHNEYINYLICEGALGLLSYLGAFISAIVIGVKNLKKNVFILPCIMGVVCYMVQAVVNIAIPITTPVFFTLMYMIIANHLELKNKIELNQSNEIK